MHQPRYITDQPLAREADRQARERRQQEARQPTPFDCAVEDLRAWLANPVGLPPAALPSQAISTFDREQRSAWALGWSEAIQVVYDHMKEQRNATA